MIQNMFFASNIFFKNINCVKIGIKSINTIENYLFYEKHFLREIKVIFEIQFL